MCFCDVIVEGLLLAANTIRALHIMTDTNQERVRNAKDSISITIQKARDRVDLRSFFFRFFFYLLFHYLIIESNLSSILKCSVEFYFFCAISSVLWAPVILLTGLRWQWGGG